MAPPTPPDAPPAPATPPDAPPPVTPKLTGAPGDGVTLDLGDRFSLNLRSRVQLRHQTHLTAPDADGARDVEGAAGLGTLRVWLGGHAYSRDLTYLIQLALAQRDYRDGATSPVYDAYLEWAAARSLRLRVGQYFVPFDRLRTIREWALQLAERPRPVAELTLDRDVGATAQWDPWPGRDTPLTVKLGAFGGNGIHATAPREPGALVVGRVEVRPLGAIDDDVEGDLARRSRPALALGVGLAKNWSSTRARSTTGATFTGGTTDYLHAAADLVFKWEGIAVELEHLWKDSSRDRIGSVDADGAPVVERPRSGRGLVAQASYVLGPPVEVVARWSRLWASRGTDPAFRAEIAARGQELGGGVNVYLNGHKLKLQTTWITLVPPAFDLSRADHTATTQLDATF